MNNKILFTGFIWLLLRISLAAQCLNASHQYFAREALSFSSGSSELDGIIRSEHYLLSQTFQLQTDLYFGGDSYGNANAFFMSTNECVTPGCVGVVAVGRNLLIQRLQKKFGVEIVKAILAHEYGHALQSKLGWHGSSKWKELHADFMAGFYMAQKSYISEELLGAFIQEFYEMGDYGFYESGHHGTPSERGCAFREGFFASRRFNLSVYGAYKGAVAYLSNNSPCQPLTISHINADLNQVRGYDGISDLSYYDPSLVLAAAAIVGTVYLANETIKYFDEVSLTIQSGFLRSEYGNFGTLSTVDLFKTLKNEDRIFISVGGSSSRTLLSAGYIRKDLIRSKPSLYLGGGLQFYGPTENSNFPLFISLRNNHKISPKWTFSEHMYLSRDIFTIGISCMYKYKKDKT